MKQGRRGPDPGPGLSLGRLLRFPADVAERVRMGIPFGFFDGGKLSTDRSFDDQRGSDKPSVISKRITQ
jgi:hypothetical protein